MQQQNYDCVLYRIAWKSLSETLIECASGLIYSFQDDMLSAPRGINTDGTRRCGFVDVIQSQGGRAAWMSYLSAAPYAPLFSEAGLHSGWLEGQS